MRALELGSVWPSVHGGGADRVFADLTRTLPAAGIAVDALFAGPADDAPPDGATLTSFAPVEAATHRRWWGARRAMAQVAARGDVDVVASHFALYASAALGWLRHVPHVVHFHGPWADESRQEGAGAASVAAKRALERVVYQTADRLIVLSEAFAAILRDGYGVPADRIRVVPGAVDVERFRPRMTRAEARAVLGWPIDGPVLVTVRRLVRRTGVDRLIEALPMVLASHPDARLMVGGTGPQHETLVGLVQFLGLEDRVTFLGYVPDAQLPLVYRAADLNVLPTVALEGFGLTAIEALAAGTPSIVTPVGGLPDVVGPLAPGLVLASSAPADIAEGIAAALAGERAVPTAEACEAYARARHAPERMVDAVARVYREAAGEAS